MESDNATAVQLVKDNAASSRGNLNIIEECRNLIKRQWEVILRHIPRE